MSRSESQRSTPLHVLRAPGWDVALLAVLLFAVLQITGLAESAALPTRVADVLRHPIPVSYTHLTLPTNREV